MQQQQPQNQNVTVVVQQQHKSNAPWILGIIAFVSSIPNILCATICAVMGTAAVAETPSDVDAAAGAFGLMLVILTIVSLVCFVLSFFGKSNASVVTGILLILGGVFILINGFIGLGSFIWGSIAGVCYLIGGVFSIINNKRVA